MVNRVSFEKAENFPWAVLDVGQVWSVELKFGPAPAPKVAGESFLLLDQKKKIIQFVFLQGDSMIRVNLKLEYLSSFKRYFNLITVINYKINVFLVFVLFSNIPNIYRIDFIYMHNIHIFLTTVINYKIFWYLGLLAI